MKILYWLMSALIAFVMGSGTLLHFRNPTYLLGFIPWSLPALPIIYASGVFELVIAIAAVVPRTRGVAGLAFAALCTAYLPLHIWDLFRDDPVITPHSAAIIRVVVQFLFIGIGWLVWKRFKPATGFVA
ncbi:hypothetical protein EUV02_14225 [Polymorphobacter arshaanensis]|uniref:DoxX family protein n=1 Tax=Glacieibacterium arshaanense TaxID=2511025 RepID=A0A4Y9EKZ1_9SPHN|nr:hypothetical protein [Polymorphobacter arshaanensis]TFU01431.1 hypothetical protein EUV02_14225 [Polymorphobacter arshaanensis]